MAEHVSARGGSADGGGAVVRKADVAVIIPTLNEEGYLPALLDSLAGQTVLPREVMIVDAGSPPTRTFAVSICITWRGCKRRTASRAGPWHQVREPPCYDPRMTFIIELEQETDGRWLAEVPDLAGVMCYGPDRDQAVARVQALALRVLAERLEHGEAPPELLNVSFQAA